MPAGKGARETDCSGRPQINRHRRGLASTVRSGETKGRVAKRLSGLDRKRCGAEGDRLRTERRRAPWRECRRRGGHADGEGAFNSGGRGGAGGGNNGDARGDREDGGRRTEEEEEEVVSRRLMGWQGIRPVSSSLLRN